MELTRATAPWAFSRGEPYRTIAALELFGTLLSIMAFSSAWPSSASGCIKLTGTTDNLGNCWILSKMMSTKFPMLIALGELAAQLRNLNASLNLVWAPRLQNEEADALTNGDFMAFRAESRVGLDLPAMSFLVLPRLVEVSEEIHQEILRRRGSTAPEGGAKAKVAKLKERDPWIQ